MNSLEDNPSEPRPELQRLFLVDDINQILEDNLDRAAIVMDESLDSVIVLSGVVEPFEEILSDGSISIADDYTVNVVRNQEGMVSLICLKDGEYAGRTNYPLHIDNKDLENLTPRQTEEDAAWRSLLSITTFSREMAEWTMNGYLEGRNILYYDISSKVKRLAGKPF